jgi:hypothetical protein
MKMQGDIQLPFPLGLLFWKCFHPMTSAPWRMDGKWLGNNCLLGSNSLANHGGWLSCIYFTTYLLTTHQKVVNK